MEGGLTCGNANPPEFCFKFDPAKDERDWGPLKAWFDCYR